MCVEEKQITIMQLKVRRFAQTLSSKLHLSVLTTMPLEQVLGTDELYNYLSKYGIELDPQLEGLVGRHARRPWIKFTNAENCHLVTPEGMDFLDKLLKYDHQVQ